MDILYYKIFYLHILKFCNNSEADSLINSFMTRKLSFGELKACFKVPKVIMIMMMMMQEIVCICPILCSLYLMLPNKSYYKLEVENIFGIISL